MAFAPPLADRKRAAFARLNSGKVTKVMAATHMRPRIYVHAHPHSRTRTHTRTRARAHTSQVLVAYNASHAPWPAETYSFGVVSALKSEYGEWCAPDPLTSVTQRLYTSL